MATPVHKTAGTNWLFVRIDTDEGISGWGEGSLQYKDAALAAEILDFGNFLIDKEKKACEEGSLSGENWCAQNKTQRTVTKNKKPNPTFFFLFI